MDKIQLIKDAIEKADRFESKLSQGAIEVPFLGSLKIRALLNNLGAISKRYLEIGSHKGGSFCSAIYNNYNLETFIAIDNWKSDELNNEKAFDIFLENADRFSPNPINLAVIKSDCFAVDLNGEYAPYLSNFDLYNFDAGHSYAEQKEALIYYKDVLADEFIYCCDDWQYGQVKEGTLAGIREGGFEVIFEQELLNTEPYTEDEHRNEEWWRGYAVFLLKKKS